MSGSRLKITLLKSPHHRIKNHRDCVRGLGLKKINDTVVRENNACIRGMVNKINYMVKVEETA